jgi:hypothetical protein
MTALSDPLLAAFITMLIDTLAVMVPGGNDDADTKEGRRNVARLLFEAFEPRDAIEAMAAARAVAAHHAAMDNFTRAAQPGVSDEKVIRLRANALAAGRTVEAALRARDKRRKEQTAAEAQAAAQPPIVDREPPRQPIVEQDPKRHSLRPDYRASTALTTTQRLEPILSQS